MTDISEGNKARFVPAEGIIDYVNNFLRAGNKISIQVDPANNRATIGVEGLEDFAYADSEAKVPDSKFPPTLLKAADIEEFAKVNTADDVPNERIPDGITRDDDVEEYAKVGTNAEVPDERIPSSVTRDDEVEGYAKVGTNTEIDDDRIASNVARDVEIESWALKVNPSTEIPEGKIPASSRGGGGGTTPTGVEDFALTTSTADVPDAKIPPSITRDTEVEDFAKVGTSTDVPDSRIPSTITRDTEVEDFAKDGNSATVPVTKIPGLVASKITSGILAIARIPNLAASKITSGVLAIARIPDLSASKITSGIFNIARIPDLSASKITSGMFALARIPVLTLAKLPAVASLLPSSLGTAGQVLQVNSGATAIEFAAASGGGFSGTLLGSVTMSVNTFISLDADFFTSSDYDADAFYLITGDLGSSILTGSLLNTTDTLWISRLVYARRITDDLRVGIRANESVGSGTAYLYKLN